MWPPPLLSFLLTAHVLHDEMRFLLRAALAADANTNCAYIIVDERQSASEMDALIGGDGFVERAVYALDAYLDDGNKTGLCKATHYVIESQDALTLIELFCCHGGVECPPKFVPYTNIAVLARLHAADRDDHWAEVRENMRCFTELHAHTVYLMLAVDEDLQILRFYQGVMDDVWNDTESGDDVDWRRWRPNFQNANQTFKAAYHHFPPYVYINDSVANGSKSDQYIGLDRYLLAEITRGWRVEYVRYRSMAFMETARDVLSGMLNTALCAVWHIRVPTDLYDVSAPYGETCVSFIVPRPQRIESVYFLINALQDDFWLAIGLCILCLSLVSYTMAKFRPNPIVSLLEAIFNIYGTLLLNTPSRISTWSSERIIFACWLIGVVILTTVYGSGISSRLTVPEYTRPVNTFEDILRDRLLWEHDGSGSYGMFNASVDPHLRRIARHAIPPGTPTPEARLVRITNVFFQRYVSNFVDVHERVHQGALLKECAGLFNYVYPLNKHSSFTRIFDAKIHMMVEGGLVEHWTKVLHMRYGGNPRFQLGVLEYVYSDSSDLITFKMVTGLFIIVGVCYLVCGLAFIGELIYHFIQTRPVLD